MSSNFYFAQSQWFMELLVAVVVVFGLAYAWRARPDGAIARSLRHRDRVWFALLVLFVPIVLLSHALFFLFLDRPVHGSGGDYWIISLILIIFHGVFYSLAGGWFTSPAKKEERFSYGIAITVTIALYFLNWALEMALRSFGPALAVNLPVIFACVVVVLFLVSRLFVGKRSGVPLPAVVDGLPEKSRPDASTAFVWLFVGLLPIPVLLCFVSPNHAQTSLAPFVFIICALCNLVGGLGCLGRINNPGVRIILGLFLGAFFFLLSWLIAAFEACSHMGGI